MIETKDMVGMPDAVKMTGLSPLTLKRRAWAGQISGTNIAGRLWVFRRSDIERLAAQPTPKISA